MKSPAENNTKDVTPDIWKGQPEGSRKIYHRLVCLFHTQVQRAPGFRRVAALVKPRMLRLWNLVFYPLVSVPGSSYFARFHLAKDPEYGHWLECFEKNSTGTWKEQYRWSKGWTDQPLISIITPLYNTPPDLLIECVESALFQSYQRWELILIDDAGNDRGSLDCLSRIARIKDPRIKVLTNKKNMGTCLSTNRGVNVASGEYIAFLDHDDRITPNALFETVRSILDHDRPDLIYSDRDLISPSGKRHDRISKPAWSPESLLSGNYLFHLMVVKKDLFLELGGYRKNFEGSQDLDFVLRLAEITNRVVHIPKVLYNFRQAETSCAYNMEAKSFIFEKGVKAVQDALDRRAIDGTAYELEHAWRGNYGIKLKNRLPYDTIVYNSHLNLADFLNHRIKSSEKAYILIKKEGVEGEKKETDSTLVSFFKLSGIGCITGKIISNNKIIHAGLINRPEGVPLSIYMNFPSETPGLLASASTMQNRSLAHPWCCVISKEIWDELGGFDNTYGGIYTIFDFAMGSLEKGYRNLFVPQSQYRTEKGKCDDIYPGDVHSYKKKWQKRLKINDPHYNQNLSLDHYDMRLRTPH